MELAELAKVLQLEPIAEEVQERVQQDAGVAGGEDEAVAIRPIRVGRVMAHYPGPQHMGQGGERHGRTRMARIGLLGGVHGQAADHVDAELLEISITGGSSAHGWSSTRSQERAHGLP